MDFFAVDFFAVDFFAVDFFAVDLFLVTFSEIDFSIRSIIESFFKLETPFIPISLDIFLRSTSFKVFKSLFLSFICTSFFVPADGLMAFCSIPE